MQINVMCIVDGNLLRHPIHGIHIRTGKNKI